jgi:hypothetical protein
MKKLLFFTINLLGLTSCFNTREPALPSSTTSWISPNEPLILIENFQKATAELNLNNYERCLNRYFIFSADPNVKGNNTGVFQRWTLLEELEYMKNISKKTLQVSANRLQFSNVVTNFITADSVEYNASYELQLYHQDSTFANYTFKGRCILALKRNSSNEWAISRWQDNKNTTSPAWTELKQHFIAP